MNEPKQLEPQVGDVWEHKDNGRRVLIMRIDSEEVKYKRRLDRRDAYWGVDMFLEKMHFIGTVDLSLLEDRK